ELIKSDPRRALAAAIPNHVRKGLRADIQEQLEAPVSGVGDLLVFCVMPRKGAQGNASVQRVVSLNGVTYQTSVYGRRAWETTKYGIPLHGVALDGFLALDENVLSELDPAKESDLTEPITDLSDLANSSAGAGPAKLARMGQKVYRFASAEHLRQ